MLASRQLSSSQFTEDFYSTILPGLIPRRDFIQWPLIDAIANHYREEISRLQDLAHTARPVQATLTTFLTTSPDPLASLRLLFRLVGHTADVHVSLEDRIDLIAEAVHLAANDDHAAEAVQKVIATLTDIGIGRVLEQDIATVLLGISIGLETHRRKNGGGTAFKLLIGDFLLDALATLQQMYPSLTLDDEVAIMYANGRQSKNVDFAYSLNGRPVIGFEVNFYTSSGSKPSEIKRSYAQVRRDLQDVGVELVWVTDGEGYMKMRKSLADAQETHPNIYNYSMLKRCLVADLLEYLAKPR